MARLPGPEELSGPGSFRSGRQYSSADTSAAARGLASFGAGLSALAEQQKQQENTVDIARAEAEKTKGLLDTQNEFDHDPDYSSFGARAPAKTGEVVNKAGALIRDPAMRERWLANAQTDAARTNDSIFDWGAKKRRDAEVIAFDDALEKSRRIYVDPDSTDEAKAKARKDIEGSIKLGMASGLLDPNDAEKRRQFYLDQADKSRGELAIQRDPDVISRPLPSNVSERVSTAMGFFQSKGWTKAQAAGIVGNLMAESTLHTGALNGGDGSDGSDSIGIGQWNGNRARALKSFAAAHGGDWRDYGVQLAFVQHELEGSEGAAGSKLKGAADVRSATDAMIMYERPSGSQNGPQSAHNYKGRLKYAAQAAGETVNPDWYDRLSPEDQQQLQNDAQTRRNQIGVESRANIDVAVTNAPAAILNTGRYDGQMPSADQFIAAYGPQEGAQRYGKFQSDVETSQQAYSMRTMSAADIQSMVESAKPTSSGDNAAIQSARYETLSKAAETTLKARETDPAAYVRNSFPSVNQAWNGVAEQPENGALYQAAIASSIAAQQQIGVANPTPLPKTVADNAVSQFKDETKPFDARISAMSSLIMATPDTGQRHEIFNQLVRSGLPDITEGAFNALSRGDTGAANRLFEAALIDPSKLPGKSPETPDSIRSHIQSDVMDVGQIGDVYYGLSDGSTDNLATAQRDSKLLSNAVEIRMRKGEALDDAISGAAKDLYGDLKPVSGNSRVNAHILIPTDQDERAVLSGLQSVLPDVKSTLEAQFAAPSAAPAGEFKGQVERGNIDLRTRPVVTNDDGTISTVRSMSFEEDGKEVLVPTVSPDGKLLSDDEAIDLYHRTGQFLGKFDNASNADAYAQALHEAQARYYEGRASGANAIGGHARDNRISDILANGYFRNMGDGYAFFDAYTATAVTGADGKPLIFHEGDFKPSEQPRSDLPPAFPGERAGDYVGKLAPPAPSQQASPSAQRSGIRTPSAQDILSGKDDVFGAR